MVESELKVGQVSLTDLQGRTVLSTEIHDRQTTLNISNMKSGVYLLQCGKHIYKIGL